MCVCVCQLHHTHYKYDNKLKERKNQQKNKNLKTKSKPGTNKPGDEMEAASTLLMLANAANMALVMLVARNVTTFPFT